MKEFQVTLESEGAVDHPDGNRRKGTRVFRLQARDKDEARSLAEQSAREERAQLMLAGGSEKETPVYKVKEVK
jgi:hypothetical protein